MTYFSSLPWKLRLRLQQSAALVALVPSQHAEHYARCLPEVVGSRQMSEPWILDFFNDKANA